MVFSLKSSNAKTSTIQHSLQNLLTMQTKIKSTFPTFVVALLVAILGFSTPLGGQNCGPVIISGLDTEYGVRIWPIGGSILHGTALMWRDVIQTGIIANLDPVHASRTQILVIGGGKNVNDEMTKFWDLIAFNLVPSKTVVYSNSITADIPSISFSPFAMIAICNTADGLGKLTLAELNQISTPARQADIAAFVNSGGGLFASSCNIGTPPYGYMNIGTPPLVSVPGGGSNSIPTALGGLGIGGMGIPPISGPYHNTFTQWPSFLSVLSNLPPDGLPGSELRPCILGGKCVTIPGESKFCCPGKNLVVNGDFEGGNLGVNTIDYTYNSTVATGATLPGQYNIVTGAQASTINRCWVAQDPSTCSNTSGKFLAMNGRTCGGKKIVWEQSFTVNDWTCYEFCASVKNLKECVCDFDVTPNIEIEFSMPGIGNITQLVNASPGACNWIDIKKQVCLWGYGSSLTIKILLDESIPGDGNDLGLDNIALIAIPNCPSPIFSITTGPFFPTYYNITATNTPTTDCPATYWEVCEYDVSSSSCITVPMSTVTNPPAWWFASTNFPGYNGITPYIPQPLLGMPPGQFAYGKLYRILLGTWGDCHGWGASIQYVGYSLRTKKMKIFTEEDVKKKPQAVLKALK